MHFKKYFKAVEKELRQIFIVIVLLIMIQNIVDQALL